MTYWQGKTVVVTGAGGFIGSHLTEELVRRGATVRAFLHYGSSGDPGLLALAPPEILDQVELVFGDLKDADAVRRALNGASVVFHLGALVGIPYSYQSPRDVVETNVLGTLNVLEGARDAALDRVVHTSTSEVYGSARHVPIDEAHPLQGQSPYAASKIGADQIAESFHRGFDLPVTIVRPFNAYGPRQSTRAIIPTIIGQALAGGALRLGSTTPTRDLNFVTDTAAGFIAAAASDEAVGQTLNVGTGVETSVADLVVKIGRIVGRELTIETDTRRLRPEKSEVDRLVADATRLRELTGWDPAVSLDEGLRRTVDWMRENSARYRPSEYGV